MGCWGEGEGGGYFWTLGWLVSSLLSIINIIVSEFREALPARIHLKSDNQPDWQNSAKE